MFPSLILIGALTPAFAQGADEAWTTLQTEHYRLHTPDVALPWAMEVAGRLEEIRARVSAEVGPGPDEPIDIVLMDPARSPNGFAIPLSDSPRMGLFPTAPTAGGGLANYRSWAEDLVVHEDAHLVHLLRESRSPLWQATMSTLGLEPNLLQPGWVIEGYATLIEGRLSGRGRPHGHERAAWLRVLAQEGRLPSYDGLSGGEGFMARSHPYLVGSAFLEWLEVQRCQPSTDVPAPGGCTALPDLWARSTARTIRGFDEAFRGVFGEPPATLYARFRAELSHAAIEQERVRPVDDSLWLDLPGATSDLALSPDGSRLAMMRRDKGRSRLVVIETDDDPEALQRWLEPHQEAAERDPEDVVAVPPATLPREPVAHREDPFRPAAYPAWLPDGSALLLTVYERDLRGQLRPDLFRWDPSTGLEKRITTDADLSLAHPFPDGTRAVALRRRWGIEELVTVDLTTGAVTPIAAFEVGVVLDRPRVDPSGLRLAYLRHEGDWRLVIRDLATGEERLPALPPGSSIADPEWSADGQSLLFALGSEGYVEIHRLDLAWEELQTLTTSRGAATHPVLSADGQTLFHLGLDSDGIDLHRLPVAPRQAAVPEAPTPLRPPVHPDPPGVIPVEPGSVSARPYGLGRPEALPLAGGSASVDGPAAELGIRVGDIIGRHELLLLGGLGRTQGGALGLTWRGPPARPGQSARLELAWIQDSPMGALSGAGVQLEERRTGPRTRWQWLLGATLLARPGEASSPAARAGASAAQRFGRVSWVEPTGDLRLLIGAPDQRALHAEVGLHAGHRALRVSGLYHRGLAGAGIGGEGFSAGGVESSLLPASLQATWLPVPWLGEGQLEGEALEHHRWSLGNEVAGLFGERYLLDGDAHSAAGVWTSADLGAQPMVRLPAMQLDLGVACRVEAAAGLDLGACRELDGWAAWARLGWGL